MRELSRGPNDPESDEDHPFIQSKWNKNKKKENITDDELCAHFHSLVFLVFFNFYFIFLEKVALHISIQWSEEITFRFSLATITYILCISLSSSHRQMHFMSAFIASNQKPDTSFNSVVCCSFIDWKKKNFFLTDSSLNCLLLVVIYIVA